MTPSSHFDAAFAAHQAGRLDDAARLYELVLSESPDHFDALHLLGTVALQRGEAERAVALLDRVVARGRPVHLPHFHLGLALAGLGRLPEAEAQFRRTVELARDFAPGHNQLGAALRRQGRHRDSIASHERAVVLDPASVPARHNLGLARRDAKDLAGASEAFRAALQLDPQFAPAVVALAETCAASGEHDEAALLYERALELLPEDAALYAGLGDCLHSMGRLAEAVVAYQHAVARNPDLADAWWGLGCATLAQRAWVEAADAFARVVALAPHAGVAWHNLGKARYELGQVDAACEALRRALSVLGPNETTLGVLATIVPGAPAADGATILAARRAWAALQPTAPRPAPRIAVGPLRVGYVSSYFQDRNWMKVVWGLINRHDRSKFEVHLFSDASAAAAGASGYRADARDRFHDISGLDAASAADLVRRQCVDVLVDLNGFSALRRLSVFALRPAPVQATWFNSYATTGLACFDALIGDEHVVAPGDDELCTEPIVRLPRNYLAFAVEYDVPDVAPPPCASRGLFTFGCLAPQYKFTPQVLATFAEILKASPGSRLLLRNRALGGASVRELVASELKKGGVASDRVDLLGPAEHFDYLRTYGEIDLALDTFPYNGGTTTIEALWQGVPVLTFHGDRWASRVSASYLRNAGLSDFVAADRAGYVEAAVHAATSPETRRRLAEFRVAPRERLMREPVCDTETLCRSIEETYRRLWEQRGAG